MSRVPWTREAVIIAYAMYCVVPFPKINNSNKLIQTAAARMNHSAASLKMKMCNLASLDHDFKATGRSGLWGGVSKLDRLVFDEFRHDWAGLSEQAAQLLGIDLFDIDEPVYNGPDKRRKHFSEISEKQARKFFRKAVLTAYDFKCCISGMVIPELLIASHIKPWNVSDKKTERIYPANGLCLNAFYDRAFDQGLITVDPDLRIWVSRRVKDAYTDEVSEEWLYNLEGESIMRPSRFRPERYLLQYHNDVVFKS